jgi:type IX secretion system PorP/SprF family membrane protein
MNRVFLISSVLFAWISLFGQSDPSYRQNQFNALQLNPAQTGAIERNEVTVLTQNSWAGIEGAPKTFTASGNFNATNQLGVGFVVLSDQIGPVKSVRVGVSSAYHLPLNKKWKMSVGLNGLVSNTNVDLNSLSTTVANDPHMAGILNSGMQLRAGWGVLIYHKKFFFGAAQPTIGKVLFMNTNMSQFVHSESFLTYAGATIPMNRDWSFRPNVVYRYISKMPTYLDMAAVFTYDKKLDLGLSYQLMGSIGATLGVEINKSLYMGYGFSYPTSQLSRVTSQSHELALRVRFGKTKSAFGFQNPRFFN